MSNILLSLIAATFAGFSLPSFELIRDKVMTQNPVVSDIAPINMPIAEIKNMLNQPETNLSQPVINKVLTSLKCASQYNVDRNNILTIIDYSLPSNEKRLWVFDLQQKKLLFYTYVSHGIKSGALVTNYFSNKYDSKASSIGVYRTQKAYYGREGLSLRLDGLDANFNDNASNRSVVMHGGWYVDEHFIKRYGRPGRSWGCPALPLTLYQPIINTIKDNSFLVAYYPSDAWFGKSKFLNCEKMNQATLVSTISVPLKPEEDKREDVLFADLGKKSRLSETNPILVMSADSYEKIFHTKAPLERMLRRQINQAEYVALSSKEFNKLAVSDKTGLSAVSFVVPVIIMVRGYYETQMKIVNLGKIKDVQFNYSVPNNNVKNYTISFEGKSGVSLRATNQFIRWVGL